MKKNILALLLITFAILASSCASTVPEKIEEKTPETVKIEETKAVVLNDETNFTEATRLTKAFYDEFFAQEIDNEAAEGRMGNAERLEVVKRKYLTEDLIEELHLRTREISADAITNSQDDIPLRGKLKFMNGKDVNTGLAVYRVDFDNGGFVQDTFELHFIDVNGVMLADELNVYHEEKSADGSEFNYEHITKFANNGGISAENRAEMENIKKQLDELEAQGFIG